MPPGGLDSQPVGETTGLIAHAGAPVPAADRSHRVAFGACGDPFPAARSAASHLGHPEPGHDRLWRAKGSPFNAGLINPVPRGIIDTNGTFGPVACRRTRPHASQRELPLSERRHERDQGARRDALVRRHVSRRAGAHRSRRHDGDVGLLSGSGGQPVPLRTTFKAIVDGTNGDTILERVDALLNNPPSSPRARLFARRKSRDAT